MSNTTINNAVLDIVGNMIGVSANVSNIIATQGNVGNVIFNAGNITTTGFVYQGMRTATYYGNGQQASSNVTPNIMVQYSTTLEPLTFGNLDLSRTNVNSGTRFTNTSSSARLFQVNTTIPFNAYDEGAAGRRCDAYIRYTSISGNASYKIAGATDSRPDMATGNDLGQTLNIGTTIRLNSDDYFEVFANATTTNGAVLTSLTNTQFDAPVITISQLN